MKRQLPEGSEASDQGTTSTGSSAEHSTDHSESIVTILQTTERKSSGVVQEKAHQGMFGPVAVVAGGGVGRGEKGAVADAPCLDQRGRGVSEDLFAALGGEADEWIVEGVKDERGHCDVFEHASGGGAV